MELSSISCFAGNSTLWSRLRPENCPTSASGCGTGGASAASSPSTWGTPPNPLRSCWGPTTLTSTWARASGSSWLRAALWLKESPQRSADVSRLRFHRLSTIKVVQTSFLFVSYTGDLSEDPEKTELLAIRSVFPPPLRVDMQSVVISGKYWCMTLIHVCSLGQNYQTLALWWVRVPLIN